jgi:glycosyltransferase involved in cell wall biosynthesis
VDGMILILCQIRGGDSMVSLTGILTETMPAQDSPKRSKRLLHVVASFAPVAGGTTEGLRNLAESCTGISGVEVASLDDPAAPFVRGHGFPVHALGPARGNYYFAPRLQGWLAQNLDRFDGVAIHGLWQYHSYGTYRVVRGRKPYVVFPHGMLDPYFKRAFPWKHVKKELYWLAREYRVLRDARAVCFTSPIERDLAAHTMWPQRWTPAVVSFGISMPEGDPAAQRAMFLARYPNLRGRRYLLFLSRIHAKKGCDLLLDAFARVTGQHPDLDLVLAGPDEGGLRPSLEAQAKHLSIADRVHWTGMVEGDLKWGALRAAAAFVLPSHQENFGVAAVEALACGVPVLISDQVNIWPDLVHDEAAIVNPDTSDGTYLSIREFLGMTREQLQNMVNNGLSCFRARYEMKRTAQALNDLFP